MWKFIVLTNLHMSQVCDRSIVVEFFFCYFLAAVLVYLRKNHVTNFAHFKFEKIMNIAVLSSRLSMLQCCMFLYYMIVVYPTFIVI